MVDELPDRVVKGRGAVSNRTGRFEAFSRVAMDDGWAHVPLPGDDDWEPPPFRTIVLNDTARTVIARNDSPDIPFEQSVNPYRGCEHGCIYCFARPTHAFLGLSPGIDFETRLFRKTDAAALLARELRAKGYICKPLAIGANTDPYQPVERTERTTRSILEVCRDFNQPVCIITKSALVTRDLDILAPMAAKGLAKVAVSVTTLDRDLARRMEPRASTPPKRLQAIRELTDAGVPTAVLASPMIPALNDHELETILEAARDQGAKRASYILLRLPLEIADLFREWLREHAPNRVERVLSLIRQSREGALYKSEFGTRMKGTGPYADMLRARFKVALARLGMNERCWDLNTSLFKPPPAPGDQLSLL